ncbi:MAG TPA: NAD-dependent epimerase/dehydratase family protein [Gemmatimonadales bacterium]|nr:NAD-dependent epimerase/dehydratase family protein [Gemmatimonadales bacterium]
MALSTRTALVAGASGLVGAQVVRLLLEDPAYSRVTVLARRELPLSHKKLEQRIASFDRLAQIADFPRVHDVFCCLGTTMKQAGSPDAFRKVDFTYVVELARVAVRHRASQFLVVTAVGADPQSRILYSRVKGEAEEALRRLQFESIQIFRPSLLVGARSQGRPAERVAGLLSLLVAWAFVGPLSRYRPIKAEAVARAMVQVAREAPRGTHVYEFKEIRRRAAKP